MEVPAEETSSTTMAEDCKWHARTSSGEITNGDADALLFSLNSNHHRQNMGFAGQKRERDSDFVELGGGGGDANKQARVG